STHVMQHAERLCDRILLIAKGRKLFDGTLPQARGLLPRRVRIETSDDVSPLRHLPEVAELRLLSNGHGTNNAENGTRIPNGNAKPVAATGWEVELRENCDPQSVLAACFEKNVRLQSYNQSEPTLHEVFVQLVGPDAKEASFR